MTMILRKWVEHEHNWHMTRAGDLFCRWGRTTNTTYLHRRGLYTSRRRLGAAGAGGRRARGPALHGDARVVGVRLAPRRLVQDGLRQLGEGAVDVDVGLGRRLHEADAVLVRYLECATTSHIDNKHLPNLYKTICFIELTMKLFVPMKSVVYLILM